MLERFAHFLLKRNRNAALVAFLCSILPVFSGSISVMIVALVTLRKGDREGFFVLAWGILPLLARAFVDKSYLFFAASVIAFVLVWGMAVIVRRYGSWSILLEISAVLGVSGVLVSLIFQETVVLWWASHVNDYMQMIVNAGYITVDEALSPAQVDGIAQVATGIEVLLLLLLAGLKVALARWWEGLAFKTVGLREELLQARFHRWGLILFVVLLLAAILMKSAACLDVLIPLAGLYVIAGLCMLHYWMQGYKYARSALLGFYVVVIMFPYVIGLALVLGLVDSGLPLRVRMLQNNVKK